jgi:hypothetical protein
MTTTSGMHWNNLVDLNQDLYMKTSSPVNKLPYGKEGRSSSTKDCRYFCLFADDEMKHVLLRFSKW